MQSQEGAFSLPVRNELAYVLILAHVHAGPFATAGGETGQRCHDDAQFSFKKLAPKTASTQARPMTAPPIGQISVIRRLLRCGYALLTPFGIAILSEY
jgi:hypothetical protein